MHPRKRAKFEASSSGSQSHKHQHGHGSGVRDTQAQIRARARVLLDAERRALPIYAARERIVQTVRDHPTTVLVGETGSGKTTQIPQFLVDDGIVPPPIRKQRRGLGPVAGDGDGRRAGAAMLGGAVAVTQPRRVAAVTVAQRVANERGVELGREVGYTVRFDDKSSDGTRIKYMTDGMLLMEAMQDPELKRYSVVVLDEAHERTLSTDILFGVVRRIQAGPRPDLKIVVMSATLEADKYAAFFPNAAPLLYVEGRLHPVDIMTPEPDYLDGALITVLQIHIDEKPGDILVFLPGRDDIESLEKLLEDKAARLPAGTLGLVVRTLFAAQPADVQMAVFEPVPDGSRKVIIATNIAETSITIKNVRYVVDSGFVKQRVFNSKTGVDALQVWG